jgi:hypothetical protein
MTPPYRVFIIKSRGYQWKVRVSPQDAHLLRNYVYQIDPGKEGTSFYPRRKAGGYGQYIYLAREIAGCGEGEFVHYRNGDSLDCRRENLYVTDSVAVAA